MKMTPLDRISTIINAIIAEISIYSTPDPIVLIHDVIFASATLSVSPVTTFGEAYMAEVFAAGTTDSAFFFIFIPRNGIAPS